MWKVAGWVLPAFFGIGSLGPWLTGEFAKSQFGRRTVEIICTSVELAGRVQKPQSPAKDPLGQLEDQDRQLRLQIEICPDEKTRRQLIEKRNRCIQAQADRARHDRQMTIRQKKNNGLAKVVLQPPTTCNERLRRRPYDAARQPPKPGSPTTDAHVSDRGDDCR
jgi:TolA-binding protein